MRSIFRTPKKNLSWQKFLAHEKYEPMYQSVQPAWFRFYAYKFTDYQSTNKQPIEKWMVSNTLSSLCSCTKIASIKQCYINSANSNCAIIPHGKNNEQAFKHL